jgi:DnaK suppressor protein
MPDQLDEAKDLEMRHRQRCLDEVLNNRAPEPPQWIDNGVVRCIDCGTPVNPNRLRAKPNAARCTYCQNIQEKKHGRN